MLRLLPVVGLLALLLTGCADVPVAAPLPAAGPTSAPATPVRTQAPASTTPRPVRAAPSRPPRVEPVQETRPCVHGDLGLSVQEVRFDADDVGREATAASDVRLRNTSRTACWLAGWPGVTFRGRGILHDCGGVPHCDPYPDKTSVFVQRRKNLPGGADRVVLQPGASTTFGITYRSPVFSYTQAYAVDIALPGDRGAAHLVLAGTDVQLAMVSRPTGGDDLDVSYGVGAFGTSARAPSS